MAYIFDDGLMTLVAVITLRKTKLQERARRWLKLLSGVVVGALALMLLLRPHWLGL